jgi:hypothetical protein
MAKSKSKSTSKAKGSSKSKSTSRKKKGIVHKVARHPFPPKTEVQVHRAFGVSPSAGMPVGKPVSKTKVANDATLEVEVPEPDLYVAAGETKNGPVERVQFRVNKK